MKRERSEIPGNDPDDIGASQPLHSTVDECGSPADSGLLDKRSVAQIRADNSIEKGLTGVQLNVARKISRNYKARSFTRKLIVKRVNWECRLLDLQAALRSTTNNVRAINRRFFSRFRK